MRAQNELLDAIQVLIDKSLKDKATKVTGGKVKSASGGRAIITINGYDYPIPYSGDAPKVGSTVRVFIPNGNMSDAFIGGSGGGGGSTGTTNYNSLTNKPSINGVTLSGNKTSTELGVYGIGNEPPYPVTSVNGQTGDVTIEAGGVTSVNGKSGAVVLTQDDVGNGTTYVRTHYDFTDAAKQQINTNKDNIATLDSDMEAAQGDITTLKGNVTTLTTALQSKQDKIVGGASTITDDNLTANRALVSNGSGKVAASVVTATELGYLDGVTSNIQTQLNKKLESAPVTSVNAKTGAVVLGASDVGAVSTANVTQTFRTSTTKVPSEKAVSDAIGAAGGGDMLKSTYDHDGSVATAGGIPNYVEANGGKIDTIKVNGVAQSIVNKEVDITVPTNNNQLTNGAGYITASEAPVTSVNGQTGDVTVSAELPEHLVKYDTLAPIETTTPINADTLQGHAASYFATKTDVSALSAVVDSNTDDITALQSNVNGKVSKSGDTMTGALIAQNNTNYSVAQVRNIIISTEDPSGGNSGDIWIKYVE